MGAALLLPPLLVAHVAVLGYWLASDLIINATYRLVALSPALPFAERDRLMEHVMRIDQHVRYALVLQVALGAMLGAVRGYWPGGTAVMAGAAVLGLAWILYIELVHRKRHQAGGARLAAIDRGLRYLLAAVLVAVAIGLAGSAWAVPLWLRLKLALFAAILLAGVGIRLVLIRHFRAWAAMRANGPDEAGNMIVRRCYWQATAVLLLLWASIFAIVILSVAKPGA